MSETATTEWEPRHPTLDGRPILVGDILIARWEHEEGVADVPFQVRGMIPDETGEWIFSGVAQGTQLPDDFYLLADECRRAPQNGSLRGGQW